MKTGRKYRNLTYVRLAWQLTPICITIFAVSVAGYILMPDDPTAGRALAGAGILFLIVGIILLSYVPNAYVQCRQKTLRLRFPLYTLDIPYTNIENTRLGDLDRYLTAQIEVSKRRRPSWSERKFLGPLRGENVLVVRFREQPRSPARLRLWIGRRWLDDSSVAVIVRDWLPLRREIDEHIAAVQADLRQQVKRPVGRGGRQ